MYNYMIRIRTDMKEKLRDEEGKLLSTPEDEESSTF